MEAKPIFDMKDLQGFKSGLSVRVGYEAMTHIRDTQRCTGYSPSYKEAAIALGYTHYAVNNAMRFAAPAEWFITKYGRPATIQITPRGHTTGSEERLFTLAEVEAHTTVTMLMKAFQLLVNVGMAIENYSKYPTWRDLIDEGFPASRKTMQRRIEQVREIGWFEINNNEGLSLTFRAWQMYHKYMPDTLEHERFAQILGQFE